MEQAFLFLTVVLSLSCNCFEKYTNVNSTEISPRAIVYKSTGFNGMQGQTLRTKHKACFSCANEAETNHEAVIFRRPSIRSLDHDDPLCYLHAWIVHDSDSLIATTTIS